MGYAISVDDADGIVEIRFFEALPHGEHLKARDEVLEICRSRKLRKILVDARELAVRGSPSTTTELFDFGVSWAQKGRGASIVLAGVLPLDANTRMQVRFGDNVAANRGLMTRGFDDIDQAKAWLRGIKR